MASGCLTMTNWVRPSRAPVHPSDELSRAKVALLRNDATMKLTRLTPDDFDRLAAMTKLGDRARAMARAVLVDGRPQADVATEYGMTKQRVNLAVGAVKRAYGKAAAPGTGWVSLELELPESLALALGGFIDALRACPEDQAQAKALAQAVRSLEAARRGLA